ncbi:MAG: hypothetical protein ABMB14_27695 [Myxococcota bacterium]
MERDAIDAALVGWAGRLRRKRWTVAANLGALALFSVPAAGIAAFGLGFSGFIGAIAATRSDPSTGLAIAAPFVAFPMVFAAMVVGALALVVADLARSARRPALVIVGRVERVAFVAGVTRGRMRFEVEVVADEGWRLSRDGAVVRVPIEPRRAVRAAPGVGRVTPEGERALVLILADGVCGWIGRTGATTTR